MFILFYDIICKYNTQVKVIAGKQIICSYILQSYLPKTNRKYVS